MTYLLDTNVCVAMFRGNAGVRRGVLSQNPDDIFLCSPVIAELYVGAYKSQFRRSNILLIEELLRDYECLHSTTRESLKFADIVSGMSSLGKAGTVFDLQIASIALSHGLTVVTNDADFSHIPNLAIEDWTIPI